jgi:hypothetical protein
VQYRPTAEELLASIAETLENELMPVLPESHVHRARVAANLARILEREMALGPDSSAREHDALAALLGHEGDVADLSRELAERLRTEDDPGFQQRAWDTLVAVARDDLAICKPGHDGWEGQ